MTYTNYELSSLALRVGMVARRAGDIIMRVYHDAANGRLEVEEKFDGSPVTKADRLAHEYICSQLPLLEEGSKDFLIISEENAQLPDYERVRKANSMYWLVDPLDGTKEFIARNGEFSINIALIENGIPVIGIIYQPTTSTLYTGWRGGDPIWCNHGSIFGGDVLMQPRKFSMSEAGLRVLVSRSHFEATNPAMSSFLGKLNEPDVSHSGSSLKFVEIAKGWSHLYPRFGPTMEWDTAAGDAILRAVGGAIIDANTGLPLVYNKPDLRNPPFIARGLTKLDIEP